MNEEILLTVESLAYRLSVPRSWIYSRTSRQSANPIPCLRLGKYLRFKWGEVEQWLRETKGGWAAQ